ncbi:MAG: ABC transporter ATP-binding protein [Oscillospiraceae bacterium]|nr:ABC transporter ATP-binding protein [Oscillospiraceae bacterium]
MSNLLEIKNLRTTFSTMQGKADAIRGVDLQVKENEILGIVGESGSGKSVTMKSVMGLLPRSAKVTADALIYKGEDLTKKKEKELRSFRGREMAMIFQDPMTALNPLRTIGYHLTEVICRYRKVSKKEAEAIAIEMLRQVGIPSPEERMKQYPHEFSGGMRQRVIISMALCCEPSLLIADEPTTALDVTIQAQILDLLKQLKQDRGMSVVLISHDMGVMANMCDRIAVMYGGVLVEEGKVDEIFYQPKHPYTKDLLRSIPRPEVTRGARLQAIDGAPPTLHNMPKGCPFATRCQYATEKCFEIMPETRVFSDTQNAKCHLLTGKEE